MYLVPGLYESENYLNSVPSDKLLACREECVFRSSVPCDEDVFHLCTFIMAQLNLDIPFDDYSGLDLYLELREILSSLY